MCPHKIILMDEPFAALAFKIATDPFVGKLCFFRVYSGTLDSGSTVLNSISITGSGNSIDSSIIGWSGSHNVLPVVTSFNPTAAAH